MPTIMGPIGYEGALVPVEVGLAQVTAQVLRAQFLAVPPALARSALLDTGAEQSTLDSALVLQLLSLGVPIVSVVPTNAPALGGMGLAAVLMVDLIILHPQGPLLQYRS